MTKQLARFTTFFLTASLAFTSCKKETTPARTNQPPVANAGPDVALMLACSQKAGFAELDGSKSSDPDNNIVWYDWALLYGAPGYILRDSNSGKSNC